MHESNYVYFNISIVLEVKEFTCMLIVIFFLPF
jgi:hypothetical protein